MTVKEILSVELSDFKSISVICKKCNVKTTFPVESLADKDHLVCESCNQRLGKNGSDYYLGEFARTIEQIRNATLFKVEFELVRDGKN